MEVQLAEAIGGTIDYQNNNMVMMIKGKRTKRPWQPSPLDLTIASATSSSIFSDNSGGGAFSKPTSSGGGSSTTEQYEEEEDMAKCLILLAQGRKESAAYDCKTCNRSFPSFQALGGHRASHKKAKGIEEEEANKNTNNNKKKKKPLMLLEEELFVHDCTQLSLQIVPNRFILPVSSHRRTGGGVRVHECSLCGAEFSSGQALGGHMRRHRTPSIVGASASNQDLAKISENGMLGLDLNLPAEEEGDSHRVVVESKYPFASKEQVIVFSAVNCHY